MQEIYIEKIVSFLEQTNKETLDHEFFKKIAKFLGELFNVSYVLIDKYSIKTPSITETVAIYNKGGFSPNMKYELAHTPCENVIDKNLCVYPKNIQKLFPKDGLLTQMNVESYMGIPLWSSNNEPIGLIAILDDKPIKDIKTMKVVLQIVAIKVGQVLEKTIYEKKIKLKEENYERLFDKNPTSLWELDFTVAYELVQNLINLDGTTIEKRLNETPEFLKECLSNSKIIHLNEASVHLFKAKNKEHLLKNIKKIANDDTFLNYQKILTELAHGKTEIVQEVSFTTLMNEIIYGVVKLNLIKSVDNHKVTASISILDSTKQKESEERYRALSESSFEAIFLSEKGVCIEANATAEKMFGYTPTEVARLKATDIIVPKDHELVMNNILSGYSQPYEVTAIRKDGTIFPAIINARTTYYNGRDVRVSSFRDITKDKQFENTIKESEEKFKNLSNLTFEGILIHEKGIVIDLNLSFEKMFGYKRNELVGEKIIDRLFPKKYHKQISENIDKKITLPYEIEGVRKDGSIFPIEIEAREIKKQKNKVFRVAAIRDITDRKKTEVDTKKLNAAVEQSANSIIITDLNGNIEYTNPKFTKLTGYTAAEVLGKNPRFLKSGEQSKEYYSKMWKNILVGKTWHGQFQNKTKSGKLFWEQVAISPIKNSKGEIINYLAIKEDITSRKESEEKLEIAFQTIKAKEAYLRNILKTSEEGFWVIDTLGNTLEANPKMCKILGYAKKELIGKNIFDFVDKNNATIFKEQLKQRDLGKSSNYEIELLNKNNNNIPCLFNTSPLYDAENKRTGSFAMVTNISKLKDSYRKLETHYIKQKNLSFSLSEKNRMLFESQNKHKNLFEQSPVSLWEVDFSTTKQLLKEKQKNTDDLKTYLDEHPNFVNKCISSINILNVNTKTLQLLGLSKKEELQNHLEGSNSEKSLRALKNEFLAIVSDDLEFTTETEYMKTDGSIVTAILKSVLIEGEGKKLVSVIDITNSRKAELEIIKAKETIEVSEKKFRELYEKSGDAILIIKNGIFVDCNKATVEMLNYNSKEEFLNSHPSKLSPKLQPDGLTSQEKAEEMMNISLKKGTHRFEWIHTKSSGENFPVEVLLTAISNKQNNKTIHCVWRDITERKQAEQEIIKAKEKAEESEELTRSITQSAPNAIITINSDGFIMSWNNASKKIFGYSSSEMLNQKLTKIIPIRYTKKHGTALQRIKQGGKERLTSKAIEMSGMRKDGTEFPIELSLSSWKMGREKCFTGIIRDITDVKLANEKLIIAKEKAEESDRLKTEFLNNMSHEIRTPMNGILGFSKLLNESNLTDKKRNIFINIIQNSSNQLLHVIDDILEISQLETKQITVKEKPVCLNDVLFELFSVFDVKAKENKTPLYLNKPLSDEESIIYTDKTKLNKIISNLLENALKFTNKGSIKFGYELSKENANSKLVIYVKDTGIGILPEKHEIIFERFSQAEKELSKNVGGLGLGLSIAKENAELLGGKISVDSKVLKGSTFTVTLPYKPVHIKSNKIDKTEEIKVNNNKCTILIAEDEEVNYMYLEIILKDKLQVNCELLHAKDGQEAVEICKNNSHIKFVLMDIKMPVMNGYEATQKIKEMYPNLPIIAQTAYSTREDKEKALTAGCDDFISKPINKDVLGSLLNKYM
jgi:PAS domain S-box-containing protein